MLVDRCIFTSSTGGLLDFKVDAAVNGYLTPAQALAVDSNSYSYAAQTTDAAGNIQQWEVGASIASSSTTSFTRTVEFSSNGNAKVNFVTPPIVTLTALQADFIQTVINDTNVTGTLSPSTLTLGWTGTLAADRLNANVVQGITNDTNIQGTITAQNLTFSWSGLLGLARGGTNADLSATGGSKEYLKQSSVGAPITVGVIPGSDVTGAALTKTDDTNVTLTLGGSPTTALLNAASITAGWTGTLALSRLAQGSNGQLIVGQTSASPLYKTISGDWTLSAAGSATLASVIAAAGGR